MKPLTRFITVLAIVPPLLASLGSQARAQTSSGIVHDAEYYILEAQNGEAWAAEDRGLDQKLAELRNRHGGGKSTSRISRRRLPSTVVK